MNRFNLILILAMGSLTAQNALAGAASISFSKHRIVLDKERKSDQITLRNSSNKAAECTLDLNHFNFTEANELRNQKSAQSTYMPANKLLRYSPRTVSIKPRTSQKVKISYRRRANFTQGEFISFFRIGCIEKSENIALGKPTIGAKINYNIPVHVRLGDLSADTQLEVLSIQSHGEGTKMVIRQHRLGNRSLVGDLKVVELGTDEELYLIKGFGLYRPAKYKDHVITFDKESSAGVKIVYQEKAESLGQVAQTLEIDSSRF